MSRSGYVDDDDGEFKIALYRQAVDRALGGKRGQAFLREMAAALDAMPTKELVTDTMVDANGVCAIGSVAVARGLDVKNLDIEDGEAVGAAFGVASSMAKEIAYMNDEYGPPGETTAARWQRMRSWVSRNLKAIPVQGSEASSKDPEP